MSDQDLISDEKSIREQVKRERRFYEHLLLYFGVITGLSVLNLVTSPGLFWVMWPALGWGVAIVMQAFQVFCRWSFFDERWEREQIRRRLEK